jgi:predicted phosphodiesterase
MNVFEWTKKKEQYVLDAKKSGHTYAEIADEIGTTPLSVRSKYRKLQKKLLKDQHPKIGFAANQTHRRPKDTRPDPILPFELELDECLVASDFHVPGESEEAVNQLIHYAIKNKIKHLIIAGDFWHQDAVSRWALKDPNMTLADEIERGIKLITRLSRYMSLYFVQGNHDTRLCSAINFSLSFSSWMRSLVGNKFNKTVFVTDFDYMFLKSNHTTFRICHPQLYSRIKTSQASALAHDLHENIIMGHQHFFSMTTNKTGEYICIDSGCMCDIKRFLYKNATTTRCPEWENGFIHVKGGKVKPICWYTF